MSDTYTPPDVAAVPPELAAQREAWVRLGYSPEAFDRAASGNQGPPQTSLHAPELSDAQASQAANQLLASRRAVAEMEGKTWDAGMEATARADIEASLAGAHHQWPDQDTRSLEEKAHDAHFAPAEHEEQYRPDIQDSVLGDLPAQERDAVLADLRGTAHALGLSVREGSALVEFMAKSVDAQRHTDGTQEARVAAVEKRNADLRRIAGSPERYAEIANAAAKALSALTPTLRDELVFSGALDDPGSIILLANAQQRRDARASA